MSQSAEEGFGRDSFGLYLDEIARTPLLDAEQEVELAKTIEAGLLAEYILDPEAHPSPELDESKILTFKKLGELATIEELEWMAEEGRRATEHFINANLRLSVSIARKFAWSTLPMLDRVQEGNMGLMHGVEMFDFTKGYKFSTYGTWWVRQAITRAIANQERIVRIPVHVLENMNVVTKAERELVIELGREPELEEIATEVDMTTERVVELMRLRRDHISLDATVGEDEDTTFGDLLPQETTTSPDDMILDADMRERVLKLLDQLGDDRQKDVIMRRFGLKTGQVQMLKEVGQAIDRTPEMARQIQTAALQKLKRMVPDRESFDNAPADMHISETEQQENQKKRQKQPNQRLLTNKEFSILEGLFEEGLDLTDEGLTELEVAMLTHYAQRHSIAAVQREFGTKPAATRSVLIKGIDKARSHIAKAQNKA